MSTLSFPRKSEDRIELELTVTDPETVAELAARPEGPERERFALTALRIGVLAMKQARGRIDAEAVRAEGERLMAGLDERLASHRKEVAYQVAASLKEYFDPESGRFNERVERLVKKDGDLERMLRRQIGVEDSELAKTLAAHLGETSPLMKLLSPDESRGLLSQLSETLRAALAAQREGILDEFSLDRKESALSRLVSELSERHEKLESDLQGSLDEVVKEFSLDKEESALSRLVKRVEEAQKRISSEFSLDAEDSALARMKRELSQILESQRKANQEFQAEVKAALEAMRARRGAELRSTTHGVDFEDAVFLFLQDASQRTGDVATATGNTTGRIRNCKVGDAVVEIGPEHAAAGARIAIEAKESASYNLALAREEIETARKNRAAGVGLFVFSRRTAPEGLEPFARYGDDVIVVWDPEDRSTDVFFSAGISVARALCTRVAADRRAEEIDLEGIDRAVRAIEKQAGGLDEIRKYAETVKSSGAKILDRARIMRDGLSREIERLDAKLGDLRESLGPEVDGAD